MFFIKMLKNLGTEPDGVSNNCDKDDMHDIQDELIINQHAEYLHKHFKLNFSHNNKVLSSIYWIPKLYISLTKARFTNIFIETPDLIDTISF